MSHAREINDWLAEHRPDWLPKIFPKGEKQGGYFLIGDPDGNPGDSLKIPLNPGKKGLRDFGNCFKGDDLELAKRGLRADTAETIRFAEELGAPSSPGPYQRRARPRATAAASRPRRVEAAQPPAEAAAKPNGGMPEPPAAHPKLGEPTFRHEYTDALGRPIFYHCRFDPPGKGKEFRPLTFIDGEWRWQDPEGRLPLYGLAELAARPNDPVLVLEGEKKTDVARDLLPDDVVIGWPHGAQAIAKVDWSPLAGRDVVLWPDNNAVGHEAMAQVAKACRAAGAASVRLVELPPDTPEGWDLGDELPEGWDVDRVELLIGTAAPPPTTLRAVDVLDFVAMKLPPRDLLLTPWLPAKGLTMVHAPRGVGKTKLALGVACALAGGDRYLRWAAEKPRRVLYLDGELPAQDLQAAAMATLAALGAKPASGMLSLVTPDLLDGFPPDLSTGEGQEAVEELLPGVELVVVDNLATLGGRGDESEGVAWLPIQGWLLDLRRRGLSVLLVHHSGKGGQQRGTSRREDVLDTVIALRRPSDYSPDEGARFEVHFEKSRGFCGEAAMPFEAWLTTAPDGELGWTMRDLADNHLESVVQLTAAGLTVRDIAKEIGISKSAVSRLQQKARQRGLLSDGD